MKSNLAERLTTERIKLDNFLKTVKKVNALAIKKEPFPFSSLIAIKDFSTFCRIHTCRLFKYVDAIKIRF